MTEPQAGGFHEFDAGLEARDLRQALEALADQFLGTGDFHRLFEVRKMQSRHRLGLPPFYLETPPEATEPQRRQLELELLEACREVGPLLAGQGKIHQAWYYLQPIEDRAFVRGVLESAPVDSENLQEMIDVAAHQGGHPGLGYRLVLQHMGTCNAISLFDGLQGSLGPVDRSELAAILVEHVSRELAVNVATVLGLASSGAVAGDAPFDLAKLLADHRDRIRGSLPHLDATHLAAVVRIGRQTVERASWETLLQLCQYGELLPESLQYPGEVPFERTYPDHRLYFASLLAGDASAFEATAVARVAGEEDPRRQAAAIEAVCELLARAGQPDRALKLALEYSPEVYGLWGSGPGLIELAARASDVDAAAQYYRRQQDLLSYAIARLLKADR